MRRAILAVALLTAAAARADDAAGAAGFLIYNLQFVAPNEVGVDVSTVPGGDPRVHLVWSGQVPLGLFGTDDWIGSPVPPLSRHRIVYGVDASLTGTSSVALRLGWRYRGTHRRGFAPIVGLGSSLEYTDAGWRPSLSPEIGVHLGKNRIVFPGLQLRAQADVYPTDPHARFLLALGYTIF
jgi:hypothetical protein